MSLSTQGAVGYYGSPVKFTNSDEILWVCSNFVLLHHIRTGQQRMLKFQGHGIACLAVNRQTNRLAISEKVISSQIYIFDLNNLELVSILDTQVPAVYTALDFSRNGDRLLTCCDEPQALLMIWNWQLGEQVVSHQLNYTVTLATFHPADPDSFCTYGDTRVCSWRMEQLWTRYDLKFKEFKWHHPNHAPTSFSWAPEGLFIGTKLGRVILLDPATMHPVNVATEDDAPEEGMPCIVAYNPPTEICSMAVNKTYVMVAGRTGMIVMFSHAGLAQKLQLAHPINTATRGILSLDCGGSGFRHVVAGSCDASIHLLQLRVETSQVEVVQITEGHCGKVTGAAPHPQPYHVLTCGMDGTVRLWNVQQHLMVTKRTFSGALTCLAAARSYLVAAVGSDCGVVRIIDLSSGNQMKVVTRWRMHAAPILALAFSSDGMMLATAGGDQCISFLATKPGCVPAVLGLVMVENVINIAFGQAADGTEVLLVLLSTGAITQLHLPDNPGLSMPSSLAAGPELKITTTDLQAHSLRTEVQFTSLLGLYGKHAGEVIAAGADKHLHRVLLPVDTSMWGGLKGRTYKSTTKVVVHGKPETFLAVSPSATTIASACSDGSIAVEPCDLQGPISPAEPAHDLMSGGATAVAFDSSGRYLVTGGADGSVLMHVVPVAESAYESKNFGSIQLPFIDDRDTFDNPAELTEVESRKLAVKQAALQQAEIIRSECREALYNMRQKLVIAIHENKSSPEGCRIPAMEFIMNRTLWESLKFNADRMLTKLRYKMQDDNTHTDVLWERMKQEFWDGMIEKGECLMGIKSSVEVSNFPLRQNKPWVLRKVTMLRLVELHERQATAPIIRPEASRLFGRSLSMSQTISGKDEVEETSASTLESQILTANPADCSSELLLYSPLELTSPTRKALQMIFNSKATVEVQQRFNVEFAKVLKQRKVEADRIIDLEAKADDVSKELRNLGCNPPSDDRAVPRLTCPSFADQIFTVNDDEVGVEKYVSPEEAARLAEQKAAEEAALLRAQKDNMFERALRQMMGGQLSSKPAETEELRTSKPSWMDGNPKDFTPEQIKQLKEWQALEKAVLEERAKRRQQLEAELRSLRASADDIAAKFDDILVGLSQQRLQACTEMAKLELYNTLLSSNLDNLVQLGGQAEKSIYASLNKAKERHTRLVQEMTELRAILEQYQEKVNHLSAEDRALDRSLKRDFGELDCYGKLLGIYKMRPNMARPEEEVQHDSLDPFPAFEAAAAAAAVDCSLDLALKPDHLDPAIWERFVDLRSQKLKAEAVLKQEQGRLALVRRELEALEVLEAPTAEAVSKGMFALADLRQQRKKMLYNVDLQFVLKQGQVEVEANGLGYDKNQEVCINRGIVEALNHVIKHKGQQKVEVVRAIKDFKKGIYSMQWENKRCDMLAVDWVEKARELQLLHVTKELHHVLKYGEDKVTGAELASLENLLRARETLHAKNVEDRQRKVKQLTDAIVEKRKHNRDAHVHLLRIGSVLDEQNMLHGSVANGDATAKRKMRSLVTLKKLQDIAKYQAHELEALRDELKRLSTRTFPSFAHMASS